MAYLSSTTRTELIAKRTTLDAQITAANTTMLSLMGNRAEEYRFDSGVGNQREKMRSLKEMRETITWLESEIDKINRRLDGKGIVNMNVRRR